jgi:predicted RNA-binding protein YlqC (UPF0109 family)
MSEVSDQLNELVKLMVDAPEEVHVDELRDDVGVKLDLSVAEEDLGKVIGRQGRTARALRCVLGARETRRDTEYELEILD